MQCLGSISKDSTIDLLKEVAKLFSVDFNPIDTNDILDIHKYLMKRTWYKIIFVLIN